MKIIRSAVRNLIVALALSTAPSAALAQTDRALEPAAYQQFGLPSADRVWTAADFASAGAAIAQVPVQQLPHWQGSRSSPMFARFVDRQSLTPCGVSNATAATRLQACMDILGGFNAIAGRYVEGSTSDPALISDIPPLMAMMLHIAGTMKPTADAFAATLDRNDPSYATRVGGLAQMHRGILMIIQGAIVTLHDERHTYPDAGILEIARALAETYPIVESILPPAERTVLEQRLREIANTDPSTDVRAALSRWAS